MQDNYLVIGNPIKHSLSPKIHKLFAQQTGENIDYSTLLVEDEKLEIILKDFFSHSQNKGMNITIPHKQKVVALCDFLSEDAKIANSVNTIVKNSNSKLEGHNTDGIGLIRDLKSKGLNLQNQHILILGAGGATRGIIAPLLKAGVEKIYIANRTEIKTQNLIKDFNFTDKLFFVDWQSLLQKENLNIDCNGLINATSLSMSDKFPTLSASVFSENLNWCYDLFYAKESTSFLKFCAQNGAENLYDGLGMLVEQAAEAFYLWRNKRVDANKVKSILVQEL